MDTLSFDEVIALLKEMPSRARTLRYIIKRGCRPYPTLWDRRDFDALPHMKEHQRSCFNCGEDRPEYLGCCWGNNSCHIWVCQECAPEVQQMVAEHREAQDVERQEAGAPAAAA